MKKFLPAFVIGLILGAAAGSFGQRALMRHWMKKGHDPERVLAKMSGDLALDEAQKRAVKSVLDAKSEKIKILRGQAESIHLAARLEIRKSLRPEQQAKFDGIVAKRDARRKERWGGQP